MSNSKSWRGCWTCRARRKKCDEAFPNCQTCSALLITCYYTAEKPVWFDNGPLQEEMVKTLKREVKEKAVMRRTLGYMREADEAASTNPANVSEGGQYTMARRGADSAPQAMRQWAAEPGVDLDTLATQMKKVWPGCDAGFMSYYLDFFFPFLFPFYQPHMLHGGRSWLLECMNEAEGMQQITMALSSYLFTIVLDAAEAGHEFCIRLNWDKLMAEMSNTFIRLSNDVSKLGRGYPDTPGKLSKAVRILGVITHLHRFDVYTAGFTSRNTHINAAVQTFKHILDIHDATPNLNVSSKFFDVMARMGPSPWPKPCDSYQITSPEQVAFRFFATLLVADDIIASTSLGEAPRLHDYHADLLANAPEGESPVDLEVVLGCQNAIMLQVGEISALAAWKRHQSSSNDLTLELTRRGDVINTAVQSHLASLQRPRQTALDKRKRLLGLFNSWEDPSARPTTQSRYVTQIWAHAALIYLLVTVHGFNQKRPEISKQVEHIIRLVNEDLSSVSLIRTVVWPFCVAGCLAEPEQQHWFRRQVERLQPSGLFVTVRKSLEIMESVWEKRNSSEHADATIGDISGCFAATGEILFLI
ncbi:hypothetical protein NQ176_g5297 [Zarea fungicola]|uniref:Uncharacterized protein n=1 Tax=Zarea fungicola TaxID=93591 RepID=A0ACC1NAB4_9HYPO|nr:hypothetical protein NQ176_g5297 [Lecanicillium fungicola]